MKAQQEQLAAEHQNRSFVCYRVEVPRFELFWHYHQEYELTYIARGSGRRLVGDSYEPFAAGDLVLVGPNLPHTWISDGDTPEGCLAFVLQLDADKLVPLLALPELTEVAKLLQGASGGISLNEKGSQAIARLVEQLEGQRGAGSVATLAAILHLLTRVKGITLASPSFQPMRGTQNQGRINRVFDYVQHNFAGQVSLAEAARLVGLSESAFCKFFKRASGKSFSDYTNEVRIAQACRLLVETDSPISTIAADCGFENIAYFNRTFLKKKGVQPKVFRRG